ncbi:hypothetical protein ACOMHN_059524 [Nucella lapillus]
MRLHHDKRPCCVMGHAEDGSIEFAALALTGESTDKLSEERQSWSGNAKTVRPLPWQKHFWSATLRFQKKPRHVLFFSEQQLTLLSQAKRWYADGTFKVVRAPFTQLWSIHAFVRVEDQAKQLPLAFAVMSGKRRRDYLAVLWALKQELRRRDLSWNLKCVTMDFEAAAWDAFRAAFPEVDVQGCSFHWGQAVWRHMQELGMQHAYQNDPAFHSYCRQLLALPYLPWEKIDGNLAELEGEATTEGQRRLCTYIHQTWIESAVWPPSSWSCFYRSIRTNNDVEGWHRRLKSKASSAGNLNLYLMLQLLAEESRLVTRGCQLLKESTIIRRQRADARSTNAKLFRI